MDDTECKTTIFWALIMCTLEAAFTHFIPVGLNVELSKLKMYSDTWSQLFA